MRNVANATVYGVRFGIALLVGVVLTGLAGCGGGSEGEKTAPGGPGAPDRIVVVTTTGMITDLVRQIGAERVEVTGLMHSGIDPHLYKPARSDIAALLDADVVFYSGLLLEGKMTDAFERAANAGPKVYAVTERIDESYLLSPAGFEGHHDPHVWMDPTAWSKAAEEIRDRLIEFDPDGEAAYRVNADRLLGEVARLDAYAERVLHSVPAGQRVLVTAHDAFNYFGRRYGYEVVGIQGISTESEAGVRDVERLVELIVSRDVGAVFVESTVSERNIRALIEGAGSRGHEVTIGGELFSDAMGAEGTYEGTYIGMIDHNVTVIARALGGEAPVDGMNGKLTTR